MKKAIVASFATLLLSALPLTASAVQTIDSPHVNLDNQASVETALGEDCSLCHFAGDTYTCQTCHSNKEITSGYDLTSAPYAQTHGGRAPAYECTVCHNPHVSLQYKGDTTNALAWGTATLDTNPVPAIGSNAMKFNVVVNSSSPVTDPAFFMAKNSETDRGLTLWMPNGSGDDPATPLHDESQDVYSFEVTDATATTITVKGGFPTATASTSSTFELHYGMLLAKKVATATPGTYSNVAGNQDNWNYRDGINPVNFPAAQGPTFGSIYVNESGSDGICQVCHTSTGHWKSDGSQDGHPTNLASYTGQSCLECHLHGSGFMVSACNACHGKNNSKGYPESLADLPNPPSGSATAGMHAKHAGTGSGEYAFACERCHTGTGMVDSATNPSLVKSDGIQIGFDAFYGGGHLTNYDGQSSVGMHLLGSNTQGYAPTNNTTVSTGNSETCSNIYCHSSGYAATESCMVSTSSTSLKWDGTSLDPQGDTDKCNNCHDNANYPTGVPYSDPSVTGAFGFNTHWTHLMNGVSCMNCHYATITNGDNKTIADYTKHVNGTVDVVPNPGYFTSYDPVTKVCSGLSCHGFKVWVNRNENAYGAGDDITCASDVELCGGTPPVVSDVSNPTGGVNFDPILDPWKVSDMKVYQNDPTVLYLKMTASDPDYHDPKVKGYCFGGGHKALFNGVFRMNFANVCKPFVSASLTSTPKTFEVVCDYGQKVVDNGGVFRINENLLWDNNPRSEGNARVAGWQDPGSSYDGVVQWTPLVNVAQVGVTTGFNYTVDPTNNVLIKARHTASNVGSTVNLEICALDPDYNEASKGHAATDPMYLEIHWSGEGTTTGDLMDLTDVESCKTFSFDFATQGNGNAVARGSAWLEAYVCDNDIVKTEKNIANDCYQTGWFAVPLN